MIDEMMNIIKLETLKINDFILVDKDSKQTIISTLIKEEDGLYVKNFVNFIRTENLLFLRFLNV